MQLQQTTTLKEAASFLRAEFSGDPETPITGINEIHKVENGDLTFVDHPKYYEKVLQSAASVIIINKRLPSTNGKSLIFSDEPFNDYVKLVNHYHQFTPSQKLISDSAEIGEGTTIQPGVFIGHHVKIGKNCRIHANVSIYDHAIIGDHVIIHSNTVIGADAFYYKYQSNRWDRLESCGNTIIHDHVEIGANCTIDKGVSGNTEIGQGSKLDNLVMIGHDTVVGKNCLFAAQVGVAGAVVIEDNVTLWGQVGVNKDLRIGANTVVLGQSGIAKSLEGNKTYFGSPAIEAREKKKEIALLRKLASVIESLKNNGNDH